MTLLGLIIFLVVVGVVLYVINTLIPMDAKIKMILNILVILVVCVIALQAVGLLSFLDKPIHLGK